MSVSERANWSDTHSLYVGLLQVEDAPDVGACLVQGSVQGGAALVDGEGGAAPVQHVAVVVHLHQTGRTHLLVLQPRGVDQNRLLLPTHTCLQQQQQQR